MSRRTEIAEVLKAPKINEQVNKLQHVSTLYPTENIVTLAEKLAEIIAAFCVALDISTCASVANDTFSSAHRIFGRGKN